MTDLQAAMSPRRKGMKPDSELTPKQLKKRRDNERYRNNKKAKQDKVKTARTTVPTKAVPMKKAKPVKVRRKRRGRRIPLGGVPPVPPPERKARAARKPNGRDTMELKLLRAGLASLELLAEMMEKK